MNARFLWAIGLFCVLQGAAFAAPPSASGGDTVSLAEYREYVTQAAEVFETGKGGGARDVARQLGPVKHVRLPDNTVVMVDTGGVVDALQRRAASPYGKSDKNDVARVQALRTLLTPAPQTGKGLREDPQKAAAGVLARSEFQYGPDTKQGEDWWTRMGKAFNKWLGDQLATFARWLNRLFGNRSPNIKPLTGLEQLAFFVKLLLIGLVVVAAVVALVYLGLHYRKSGGWGRRRRKSGTDGGILDATEEELLDPLASAHSLAGSGDYRSAVRLVYIASLRRLADAGVLTLHANRTNWEYQRALRFRSRPAYELMLPATRLFDRIWYGRQAATRTEYENVVAIHDGLAAALQPVEAEPSEPVETAADAAQ